MKVKLEILMISQALYNNETIIISTTTCVVIVVVIVFDVMWCFPFLFYHNVAD